MNYHISRLKVHWNWRQSYPEIFNRIYSEYSEVIYKLIISKLIVHRKSNKPFSEKWQRYTHVTYFSPEIAPREAPQQHLPLKDRLRVNCRMWTPSWIFWRVDMRIDIFEDFVPRALRYVLSHFRRICVHAQYGGKLMQLLTTSYFPPPGSLSSTISREPVLLEESESTLSTSIAREPVWKLTNGAWCSAQSFLDRWRYWILEMMQFAWFSS